MPSNMAPLKSTWLSTLGHSRLATWIWPPGISAAWCKPLTSMVRWLKVIIETALLSDEEKIIACLLAKEDGADFVKTSTGFSGGGATVKDVALMRKTVGPDMGVKASGGVRTYEDAENMILAGATRIGASAGVKIIQGPGLSGQDLPSKGY